MNGSFLPRELVLSIDSHTQIYLYPTVNYSLTTPLTTSMTKCLHSATYDWWPVSFEIYDRLESKSLTASIAGATTGLVALDHQIIESTCDIIRDSLAVIIRVMRLTPKILLHRTIISSWITVAYWKIVASSHYNICIQQQQCHLWKSLDVISQVRSNWLLVVVCSANTI